MDSWISNLAAHGFVILFAAVFLEAIGFPVPAALALLIAGGASARGALPAPYALSGAIAAMLVGDTLMFLVGRYTGWWLLGVLCRISLNPESCILRSADSFYRRGARNDGRGTYIRCSQPRLSRPQGDAHHRLSTVGPEHSSSIQ
jgi:membrane protein DedA with SNARE-associated domain